MDKPFSQACENNKAPLFAHLGPLLADKTRVLEIGSGTGQHAVWFAPQLPHLVWQPSDVAENHGAINAWLKAFPAANLLPPITLDVSRSAWPTASFDAVYSANTVHIMAWPEVEIMFEEVADMLPPFGLFCLYGPMMYHGQHTSVSNQQFDLHLRATVSCRGIREFHALNTLARNGGLILVDDHPLPANNRLVVWQKA